MIHNALNKQPLPVYGDGQNIRDWIHVSDHCDAIFTIFTQGAEGEVYNIGGNCELKNIDIGIINTKYPIWHVLVLMVLIQSII